MAKSGYGYERQICGLKRRTFYISLIVVIVICAAAIGGGVGGGVSARNRNNRTSSDDSSSPASTSSTHPTPTSAASSAPPSSSAPSKTSGSSSSPSSSPTGLVTLNNMTSPYSFAFQGFTKPNYGGEASRIFHNRGFYDLGLDVISYVWVSNSSCCVTFCADKETATGYRCTPRKRDEASGTVPRIFIWCNQDVDTYKGAANETCAPL